MLLPTSYLDKLIVRYKLIIANFKHKIKCAYSVRVRVEIETENDAKIKRIELVIAGVV